MSPFFQPCTVHGARAWNLSEEGATVKDVRLELVLGDGVFADAVPTWQAPTFWPMSLYDPRGMMPHKRSQECAVGALIDIISGTCRGHLNVKVL
jgi:hypothetical protein